MPFFDSVVLAAIVTVFITFGVVLGALTWYCSDKRKHATHNPRHRHYDYPTGRGLNTGDD